MAYYLRGQVSKATGLNIETLRFYEEIGLIPSPERSNGGYRLYTEAILNRLEFIKRAKNSGFSLDEIKQLLLILDNRILDEQFISELLDKKVNDIDQEISALIGMKDFLLKVKSNIHNPDKCSLLQSLLRP